MKIKVKVHANSFKEKIIVNNGSLEIWIKEKPIDNKANTKLIRLLEKYLKKKVSIKSGFKSRIKIIEAM